MTTQNLAWTAVGVLAAIGALTVLGTIARLWVGRHRHRWDRVLAARPVEEWSIDNRPPYRGTYQMLIQCTRCRRVKARILPRPLASTVDVYGGSAWDVADLLSMHDRLLTGRRDADLIRGWLPDAVVDAVHRVEKASACGESVRDPMGNWRGYCLLPDGGHEGEEHTTTAPTPEETP